MEVQDDKRKKISNYIFIGFICIGVGLGLYMRKPAPGALVGVGIGFLARALYNSANKQ